MSKKRWSQSRARTVELAIWLALVSGAIFLIVRGLCIMNLGEMTETRQIEAFVHDLDGMYIGNLTTKISSIGAITALERVSVSIDVDWLHPLDRNSTFSAEFEGAYAEFVFPLNDTATLMTATVPLMRNWTMPETHLESRGNSTLVWTGSGSYGATIKQTNTENMLIEYNTTLTIDVESLEKADQCRAERNSTGLQWIAIGSALVIGSSFLYGARKALSINLPPSKECYERTIPRGRLSMKDVVGKVFHLPPSLWAVFSGSELGMALGFAQDLFRSSDPSTNPAMGGLAICFSLCSAMSFSYISISLEDLREDLRETPEKGDHLDTLITDRSATFFFVFLVGMVFIAMSLYSEYLALR